MFLNCSLFALFSSLPSLNLFSEARLDLYFSLEDFVEVDGVTDDDGHSDQSDDEHHLEG